MATAFKLGAEAEKYTCPYCKTQFKESDEAISCPACQTLHHANCWEENKGCTTFGCSEQHYEEQHTNPTDVCVNCGAPLGDGQEFCPKCGTKVAIKKMSKKKKKIIISSIAAVLFIAFALVFGLYILPKYIMPQINLRKATTAFEQEDYATAIECFEKSGFQNDAENSNQYTYAVAMTRYNVNEYTAAATAFSKTNGLLDSNDKIFSCGLALEEMQDYENAVDCFTLLTTSEAKGHKAYCEGMVAYKKEDYNTAISKLTTAESTIETVSGFLPQVCYEYGVSLFEKKDYSAATTQFEKAGEYSDAKTYVTGCSLMQAENLLTEGKLNEAKNAFSKLPQNFSFNNISVTNRMSSLNNAGAFTSVCGKWAPTKNYIETRNVYDRTGSWDGWYIDEVISDQSLEIYCYLNSDGTVTIKGNISFYRYTDYSSLAAYCNATKTTKSFTISNLKSIPSSYNIDSNTILKYSNGNFVLEYSVRDNYSAHFHNLYKSSVTFGSRSKAY